MVVMCALHLAIFLEISGAVAFLHSLLMRLIVASDKVADAILFLLPALLCSVYLFKCAYVDVYYFLCFLVLSICLTYKSLSGCAMLRSQIPI